jgi:hypothetical protein
MKTRVLLFMLIIVSASILFLVGCATQSVEIIPAKLPGFLMGFVHGFILLFSFITSLFTDYRIYAFPNAGVWYDFGFLTGVLFFFGGGGAGVRS